MNTLYVNTITPFADAEASLETINEAVAEFYTSTQGLLSPQVSGNLHTVKAYDMSLPEGTRSPISPITFELTAGSQPLPAEVALVVTLEAAPQPGVAPMSTKGRIFIGPLSSSTLNAGAGAAGSRPADTTIAAFLARSYAMMTNINAVGPATLCVASQRQDKADLADGARFAYPVRAISIDNAWDTQRSRGNRASLRTRGVVGPDGLPRSW